MTPETLRRPNAGKGFCGGYDLVCEGGPRR